MNDRDAIEAAQALHRQACERLKVKPRETVGEIAIAEGKKLVTLFDANGRLAAIYRVTDNAVIDLDGAELVRLRPKIVHRKVRS